MAIPNLKKKLIIIPKNLVPLPDQRWHTNIFCKEERIHSDAKTGCCETKKTQIANTIFSAFFFWWFALPPMINMFCNNSFDFCLNCPPPSATTSGSSHPKICISNVLHMLQSYYMLSFRRRWKLLLSMMKIRYSFVEWKWKQQQLFYQKKDVVQYFSTKPPTKVSQFVPFSFPPICL